MSILILILVALAASVTALAAVRHPRISCPAAGVASGVLLVLAGELALAGHYAHAIAAGVTGTTAGAWGLWHAFVQANHRPDLDPYAEYPYITDHREGLDGHTITVERVDHAHAHARAWMGILPDGERQAEKWIGRLAVVERAGGDLLKVVAVDGVTGDDIHLAARAAASAYGARYVPVGADPDSSWSVRHDIAVDNTAGGAL